MLSKFSASLLGLVLLVACDATKDASPSGPAPADTAKADPGLSKPSYAGNWTQVKFDVHLSRTVILRFDSDTSGMATNVVSNDSVAIRRSSTLVFGSTFGDWSYALAGDTLKLSAYDVVRTFVRGSSAVSSDTSWSLEVTSKAWSETFKGKDTTRRVLMNYDTLHWSATDTNLAGIWRLVRYNSRLDTSYTFVFNGAGTGWLVDNYYGELSAITYSGKFPSYRMYSRLGGNRPFSILAGDTLYLGFDEQQARFVRRFKAPVP